MNPIFASIIDCGRQLHGINHKQFDKVLGFVKKAEELGQRPALKGGVFDKLAWVRLQIGIYLASPAGKAMMGMLTTRAINWLIETAVAYLSHA